MKGRLAMFFLIAATCCGCVEILNEKGDVDTASIDLLTIPDGFSYETARSFEISAYTLDNGGQPLQRIALDYGFKSDTGFVKLGTVVTDQVGHTVFSNTLPTYIDSLCIKTSYLGLPSETSFSVSSVEGEVILGGNHDSRGTGNGGRQLSESSGRGAAKFFTMGAYDSHGVPNYLEPVNDYVPQDILEMVNASLPEMSPVPAANPQYIADNINPDTRLLDSADVWVTFIHEGAGYLNSLGYYTYDLRHPPTSVSDVSRLTIVFPNVSFPGSGGNLRTGNKVYLGKFPPNTGIGWFLIPNGWNGSAVSDRPEIKYSTKGLNTFAGSAYRQHVVQLKSDARQLLLLGFEDISRPGGDNDFNDAVFIVTANPYSAVVNDSSVGTAKPAAGKDTDLDGVLDKNDSYPTDKERAFDVYSPGQNAFGTLAFEDQWPEKGDYDLNDLVIDYNFRFVTNASNFVTECSAELKVRAVGASLRNGFGIELPVPSALIQSVKGSIPGSIALNEQGIEPGMQKATLIVFTDAQELFHTNGLVNTISSTDARSAYDISLSIKFTSPIKMAELGYAPFNPFLIVDGNRDIEVHLADMEPTAKAARQLLGSSADSSDPARKRYYKAGNNLPWAINLSTQFDYPMENRPISEAYLKFASWSQSAGTSYKDWFLDRAGYRNTQKIYK